MAQHMLESEPGQQVPHRIIGLELRVTHVAVESDHQVPSSKLGVAIGR